MMLVICSVSTRYGPNHIRILPFSFPQFRQRNIYIRIHIEHKIIMIDLSVNVNRHCFCFHPYLLVVFWQSIESNVSRRMDESPSEREGGMETRMLSIFHDSSKLDASRFF